MTAWGVIAALWLAVSVAGVAGLAWQCRRPITPVDVYCAWADRRLDEIEAGR